MAKEKRIFIKQDDLKEELDRVGEKLWGTEYTSLPISIHNKNSNNEFFRLQFSVNQRNAQIDCYKNKNNEFKFVCGGKNQDLSEKLKAELLANHCSAENKADTCCFDNIKEESFNSLQNYLWNEKTVKNKTKKDSSLDSNNTHSSLKIQSDYGDKLTITYYKTGKLILQGKPAYLMAMTICHIASFSEVTEKNILTNYEKLLNFAQNKIQIEPFENLKKELPNAYNKVDDTVLKILSPALILSKKNLNLSDYSCYTFPALKALECLLVLILNKKSIFYDPKKGFGSIFSFDKANSIHILATPHTSFFDNNGQKVLCSIYNYYNKHRHTLFHCDSPLMVSRIIPDDKEACNIIQDVINFFEEAAIKNLI